MNTLPILRRRRARRMEFRQQGAERSNRALLSAGLLFAALLGLALLGLAFAYASLTRDLPSPTLLAALLDPSTGELLQPTRLLDRDEQAVLAVLAPQDSPRPFVAFNPGDSLARVTIALADPQFWNHTGYDIAGLFDPSSHPTLAQKLAADLLLWDEPPSVRRALRERLLAAQLTSIYGRQKILDWYLNSAHYGGRAYGAETASQLYLGKPAQALTLAESALLAAVSQTPALDPHSAPQAAREAQQATLARLEQDNSSFTAAEIALARQQDLVFQPPQPNRDLAPAFVQFALAQIQPESARARFERGGVLLITSLDLRLQTQAACAAQTQLARLANQADPAAECPAARELGALPPAESLSASASLVILDPRAGHVLAWVGDIKNGQESALLTAHRPGTLLTPFIYLTGFTRGLSPATLVWDIPPVDAASAPAPAQGYHGPVRLRVALANDYLAPAQAVLRQMGLPAVLQTMRPFGLDVAPAADGGLLTSETPLSPLALAQAYGVFAAEGALVGQPRPTAILRASSLGARTLRQWDSAGAAQVVSPQLAYLVNQALADETIRQRSGAFSIGRPVAVKMGDSLTGRDAWTVAYSPRRVVVVWMGGEGISARPAEALASAVMQAASQFLPAEGWNEPPGLTRLVVCDPSGLLPGDACPNRVSEIFIQGYEPAQVDALYRKIAVNRETGLLATVFTPRQLVDERVYLVVPPDAADWARSAGLDVPPSTYDTIQPPAPNAGVHISSPGMFTTLQGRVAIRGSAAGDDFSFYRLQYGFGLNPSSWIQIGGDQAEAVNEALLGEWDTGGLNGLLALQLLVVRADGRIETATAQVNVDNSPPQVGLVFPAQGARLPLAENRQMIFEPQVSDNLALAQVDVYLDGWLLGSFEGAPGPLAWTAISGAHTLRVMARDQAGNEQVLEVMFEIMP